MSKLKRSMKKHTSPLNDNGSNIRNSFLRDLVNKTPSVKDRNGFQQTKLLH